VTLSDPRSDSPWLMTARSDSSRIRDLIPIAGPRGGGERANSRNTYLERGRGEGERNGRRNKARGTLCRRDIQVFAYFQLSIWFRFSNYEALPDRRKYFGEPASGKRAVLTLRNVFFP